MKQTGSQPTGYIDIFIFTQAETQRNERQIKGASRIDHGEDQRLAFAIYINSSTD